MHPRDDADSQARQKFNKPLPELIVMCYFNDMCPDCKGDGIVKAKQRNLSGGLLDPRIEVT